MASQELQFAIRAINEASRTLREVQGDIDRVGTSSEKSSGFLGKFGSGLGSVASIASGFVVAQAAIALPGLLSSAASAAAEDEAATLRLNKALENYSDTAGGGSDLTQRLVADMDKRIAAGQKLAFTDDQVRDSMRTLLAATGNYDEAVQRQNAAMDLARGKGISLEQASTLLARANEENVNVLRRMGIVLEDNATEMDLLAAVQQKFGGQAEQFADSTAGGWERSKIRLGELAEGLGSILLPALDAIVSFGNSTLLPFLEAIPRVLQAAVERFQPIFDEYVRPAFEQFQAYYEENIRPALDNIATAVRILVEFIVARFNELMPILGPIFDQLVLVIQTAWGIISEVIQIVIDLIAGDFSGAWTNLQQLVTVVWDGIVGTVRNAISLILGLGGVIFNAGKSLGESLFNGLRTALSAVGGLALDIASAVGGAIRQFINNNVISRINRAVEFRIELPFLGSFFVNPPDIPFLAQGGIVTRPTLAVLGEAGPEAVVPLGRGGGGIGATYNIVVNALDPRAAADAVLEALVNLESSGRLTPGVTAA